MGGGSSKELTKPMPANPNAREGRAILDSVASQIPVFGRLLVVKNSNDSADYNYQDLAEIFPDGPLGRIMFFTDLATAYAEAQTNNNDVIALDSHTSHKVSSMLTIAKNRVHFFGFDSANRTSNQRTLISNTGTGAATDISMVNVTGTGCSFRNIAFKNNWTVAQNLSAMLEYGNNSLYKNCSFQNIGSAHLTNVNAAALILAAGDAEFHECNIGADTLQSTVASGQTLLIKKGTSAQAATRCLFNKCILRAYTSQSTYAFVRISADGDIDREVFFRDCELINFKTSSNGTTMAVAVASASGLASGGMYFSNCHSFNTTDFATSAVGNASLLVIGGTTPTAGSDGVAIQPTA